MISPRHLSRRALVLGAGPLAVLTLAACGGDDDTAPADDTTGRNGADGDAGTGSDQGGAASDAGGASDGGGASGDRDIDRSVPYLELASGSDGPVVDLLLDFRCPPCKYFMETYGDYFEQLVAEEKAVLRIHPRPMLDERRRSTYSQDTASAAAAVYAQDPALLLPFEHEMYAAQAPSGEDPDPDLQQIVDIAKGVGADETAVQQIMDRAYVDWTLEVVEPAAMALQVGTPTMLIDGEIWEGDWTQSGSVQEAIGV